MQGYNAICWVNGEIESAYRTPLRADKIVKSYAPTMEKAQREKRKLEEKYDGPTTIRSRA